MERNVESCTACPRGFYESVSKLECNGCDRGTFGTLEEQPSKTSCTNCVAGRHSNKDGYDGSDSSLIPCESCNAGYWSNTVGATKESVCKSCTAGKFSSFVASATDQCENCDSGKFLESIGAGSPDDCDNCPAGFSQSQPGQTYWYAFFLLVADVVPSLKCEMELR